MLKQLSIQNYALIQNLEISFSKGLTTITGETGAGKSILLGGLGLALGNRADFSVLQDKGKKCIIEVTFDLSGYPLQKFFEKNDLDFENESLIRREISPQGKSRAFINDTPVNLDLLRKLGSFLIDVHSQHQSLQLSDTAYQMEVLDAVADNLKHLVEYRTAFSKYAKEKKYLEELREKAAALSTEEEYLKFQFDELEELSPQLGEQEELEKEQHILSHLEEIKTVLNEVHYAFSENEENILGRLNEVQNRLNTILQHHSSSSELAQRIKSSYLELSDIASEVEAENEKLVYDPERARIVEDRLSALYSLQQKHKVKNIGELLDTMQHIDAKLNEISSFDSEIEKLEAGIQEKLLHLQKLAEKISQKREKAFPQLKQKLEGILSNVGIPNASILKAHQISEQIHKQGIDQIEILFSANKGSVPQPIHKVASGGELSRLMLAIKSVLADYKSLPTIIFDEIDSGVSGDVANKMGNILQRMAANRQVISITHLPQLAAKGNDHLFVFKKTAEGKTFSAIRKLEKDERVEQLAVMLSGESLSQAAMDNARELLNQ